MNTVLSYSCRMDFRINAIAELSSDHVHASHGRINKNSFELPDGNRKDQKR